MDATREAEPDVRPEEETPLCTRCLTPHAPEDYYCAQCGAAVGQYTAYLPFIDIPFLANFYARLWRRAWFERGVPLASRVFALALVLWLAPYVVFALPFALLGLRRDADAADGGEG